MSAYQWNDLMEGDGPASLADLPCDHWQVKENPKSATYALLCFFCGWYRHIPDADVEAAKSMGSAIEELFGDEDE